MKLYQKEIAITAVQGLLFYILPLFAGPTDAMGMVVLLLAAAVVLGFLMGLCSGRKVKYLYPLAAALLFLPSVLLYYNVSATVHALWYLVSSALGLAVGCAVRKIARL